MGRTNACRAQQKRERNAKKEGSVAHSQLKANQGAMNIKCAICMQTFMTVTSAKSLKEHSDAKHPKKTFAECFPDAQEDEE